MHARGRQGGWSLLIVLVALAIVAYLARDSLLQAFGMLSRAPTVGNARLPVGVQPASDSTQATPTFAAPIERAHAVEDVVRRQAEQLGKRIDESR